MADKKSFVLYADYDEHFEELTDEELGQLFRSIFTYVNTGAVPEMERTVRMAFSFIRKNLDRDKAKYEEICRKRKEAGSKGGRPPKASADGENQTEAKKPNGFSENQTEAKKPDTDTVTVTETETVTETVIYNRGNSDESPKKKTSRFIPPTVEDVRAYCIERGNSISPEAFVDFYASKGWMVGKNKMKDWKAAIRTWEKGESRQQQPMKPSAPKAYSNPALDYVRELERRGIE